MNTNDGIIKKGSLQPTGTVFLLVILIFGIESVASFSNPSWHQAFAQEDGSSDTTDDGGDTGTVDTTDGGGDTGTTDTGQISSHSCHPSSEACSASDVLLNDDGSVLCDPSDGTDCSQYLNPPQAAPADQGDTGAPPADQGDTGAPPADQGNNGGPLPEFDYLTKGDPDAPVTQATDPPGQYCNPTVETCDAATVSPGGCFTDIITHSSSCDYKQGAPDSSIPTTDTSVPQSEEQQTSENNQGATTCEDPSQSFDPNTETCQ